MEVKIINKSGLPDPVYATEFSSGMDLCSCSLDDIVIEPLQRLVVKTGIYLEIPEGYEAQIRPRSGMSLKHGITCINSPGTIDADYRGEIGVILINLSKESYIIKHGDRIAQMVFAPFTKVKFVKTDELSETVRGDGGYGHTGKNDVMNCKSDSTCTSKMVFVLPTDGLCDANLNKHLMSELMDDYNKGYTFDDETGTVIINESFELQPLPKDWFFPIKDDKNISIELNTDIFADELTKIQTNSKDFWLYSPDEGTPDIDDFSIIDYYDFTEEEYNIHKDQSSNVILRKQMYEVVYDKKQENIIDCIELEPTTFVKRIDPDSGSIIWIQYPDKQEKRRILNDAQIIFKDKDEYVDQGDLKYFKEKVRNVFIKATKLPTSYFK